jgi:PIN domain nuclease of toxin-antitoxin system
VRLLLDTHVVLWWMDDPRVVSEEARRSIADPGSDVFVSAAAAWEITIKKSLGKLEAPDDLDVAIKDARFETLPITVRHAVEVQHLPPIHQDPFDRIQIAQAIHEDLTLVTRNARILTYDVRTLEA